MKNIKICYGKEIHMTKSNTSYEELLQFVKNSFKKQPECMYLYYKDQDGDNITISCDEDIKAMLETCQGTAKIYIDKEIELSQQSSQEYQKIALCSSQALSSAFTSNIICSKDTADQYQQQQKESQQSEQIQQQKQEEQQVTQVQQQQQKEEPQKVQGQDINFTLKQPCDVCTYLNDLSSLFCKVCFSPLPQQQQTEVIQLNDQTTTDQQQQKVNEIEKPQENVEEQKPTQQNQPQLIIKEQIKQKKTCLRAKACKVLSDDKQIEKLIKKELRSLIPQVVDKVKSKLPQQQQQNKEEDENSYQSQVVHKFVICDGCEKKYITGIRYKCAVCEDFDFCEKCEATKEHNHPFLKIRKPELAPKFLICGIDEESNQRAYRNLFNRKAHIFATESQQCKQAFSGFFNKMKESLAKPQEKKPEQQKEQQKEVQVHVFETLLNKKQQKPETKQEQQAKKVAEVLGGQPADFMDAISVYPEKDANELVRIILAEREAAEKYTQQVSQVSRSQSTTYSQIQTPNQVETSCVQIKEKKLKKQFSQNVIQKAQSISEILGGDYQQYLGIADNFLFSGVEQLIDMILEDASLTQKYSSYL